jgi:hypothetical protein
LKQDIRTCSKNGLQCGVEDKGSLFKAQDNPERARIVRNAMAEIDEIYLTGGEIATEGDDDASVPAYSPDMSVLVQIKQRVRCETGNAKILHRK